MFITKTLFEFHQVFHSSTTYFEIGVTPVPTSLPRSSCCCRHTNHHDYDYDYDHDRV